MHFPILEYKLGLGPYALIKIGDRNLELIHVQRVMAKFLITKYGVFELDGEYEYKFEGQPLYIFNFNNAKPISLRAIEELQDMWKRNDMDTLGDHIETVETAIEQAKNQDSPVRILKSLKHKEGSSMSQHTAKFLVDYRIYDDKDTKLLISDSVLSKKAIETWSKPVGTNMPTAIFAGIGIAAVLLMQQLPHWLHFF